MKNLSSYRAEFPHTRSDCIYLDHAAVAPMNDRVKANIETFIRQAQGSKFDSWSDTMEQAARARAQFAALIHAPAERIAIVKNTTDGLLLLARGLRWQPGDRIVLHRREFPSNVYPWWDLQPFGVELDFLATEQGAVTPADLERVATDRTRLVAVSWVQYSSGYRNALRPLADWCHRRGILLAVDGMQGLGALHFDIRAVGADLVAAGTAKWLLGPQGIGFVYITEELQNRIHPPHLGWQSRADLRDFHNYTQPLRAEASRFEFATPFSLGVWGVTGALELLLEAGQPAIEKRVIELTDYLVRRLTEAGYRVRSDRRPEAKSGIVIVSHRDPARNEAIQADLERQDIHCSLRDGNLRISPHFYNTEAEIERLVEAGSLLFSE